MFREIFAMYDRYLDNISHIDAEVYGKLAQIIKDLSLEQMDAYYAKHRAPMLYGFYIQSKFDSPDISYAEKMVYSNKLSEIKNALFGDQTKQQPMSKINPLLQNMGCIPKIGRAHV